MILHDPGQTPSCSSAGDRSLAAPDIGQLFDDHAAFLVRVVEHLTGSAAYAEDIVQEVFIIAHTRRDALREVDNPRSWLYRVAVNLAKHFHRSRARHSRMTERLRQRPLEAVSDGPEEAVQRSENLQRIHACLQDLTDVERESFVLFELEGLEGRDIADILGIGENTLWARLARGRKRFRKAWKKRTREVGR